MDPLLLTLQMCSYIELKASIVLPRKGELNQFIARQRHKQLSKHALDLLRVAFACLSAACAVHCIDITHHQDFILMLSLRKKKLVAVLLMAVIYRERKRRKQLREQRRRELEIQRKRNLEKHLLHLSRIR